MHTYQEELAWAIDKQLWVIKFIHGSVWFFDTYKLLCKIQDQLKFNLPLAKWYSLREIDHMQIFAIGIVLWLKVKRKVMQSKVKHRFWCTEYIEVPPP